MASSLHSTRAVETRWRRPQADFRAPPAIRRCPGISPRRSTVARTPPPRLQDALRAAAAAVDRSLSGEAPPSGFPRAFALLRAGARGACPGDLGAPFASLRCGAASPPGCRCGPLSPLRAEPVPARFPARLGCPGRRRGPGVAGARGARSQQPGAARGHVPDPRCAAGGPGRIHVGHRADPPVRGGGQKAGPAEPTAGPD